MLHRLCLLLCASCHTTQIVVHQEAVLTEKVCSSSLCCTDLCASCHVMQIDKCAPLLSESNAHWKGLFVQSLPLYLLLYAICHVFSCCMLRVQIIICSLNQHCCVSVNRTSNPLFTILKKANRNFTGNHIWVQPRQHCCLSICRYLEFNKYYQNKSKTDGEASWLV